MMLELSQSQTWSTEVGRRGVEVRVCSGQVWITRERDSEDHVVVAPQGFESARRGKLVVFALSPARIEVSPLVVPVAEAERFAHAVLR